MAKKTHGRFRSSRKHMTTAPKKPARENNRHHFQQSAVLERCICGELKDDPIHIRRRGKVPVEGPPPRELVQVGISPDTPTARLWAQELLHWSFVERVDEGVWHVAAIRPWPTNVGFSAEITLPDGSEITINLEWP